ncbi:hypothetical protein QJS10_CPA09g00524 [Acorus calamus]|uniref:L-ascorbate oxidase n=1 Tax=Acorus calamus TaxID=4465 RepID=A0AAV9E479_ACOCL|nr:hypothetical protein QJS10_CPA09g00524 [Acorus calamus]
MAVMAATKKRRRSEEKPNHAVNLILDHLDDIPLSGGSKDCFQKLAVTINGRTPGPTIYAQQGDTVVVEIGTPWSDGTEGVTQCPIVPGDTFTYKFVVDRAGTYIYHAHYGMQRSAGLNGMIIVSVPDGVSEPFSYDYDQSILLNDWWHKSTYEQAAGLNSVPFVWIGEPQNKIDGRIKWAMNNMSFTLPDTPYLVALKQRLHHVFTQKPAPETYDSKNFDVFGVAKNANATSGNSIYRLKFNSTIDIILQNANTMTANNSETHPWHLHGHDFWVLGYGIGKFDPMNDPKKYNLVDSIMKNTVALHRYGWTALRFRADNPGVWAFHCHIEAHFFMGMGVVFEGVEKVGRLPLSIMGCGETKRLIRH